LHLLDIATPGTKVKDVQGKSRPVEIGWDPGSAATELREQLASPRRRLGLFLGAGTSMALGFPGVQQLTEDVRAALGEGERTHYEYFLEQGARNVEDVLSQVRLCRELIGESSMQPIDGLDGAGAAELDRAICEAIHQRVSGKPPKGDGPARVLAHWLAQTHRQRDYPVEVFTTNYDLVLERAMEAAGVPFFDGFVGSVEPFFAPESVDPVGRAELQEVSPPRAWTRIWKLHGSISWRLVPATPADRIARVGQIEDATGELMIFPSREKYAESRRLPFITLQDRFRHFLAGGEALLLVLGYSFSDEHLNEILLQGLRANSRLAAVALVHGARDGGDLTTPENVLAHADRHRNLAVLGPDRACYGGVVRGWEPPTSPNLVDAPYWDETNARFRLGDFNAFAAWIEKYLFGQAPSPMQASSPDEARMGEQ
jgi:SIR2-like domain